MGKKALRAREEAIWQVVTVVPTVAAPAVPEAVADFSRFRYSTAGIREGEGAMGETVRFGISMDEELLESFDKLIDRKRYANRSEAIRDLIRAALVELEWEEDEKEAVGTVTLVYNHHVRDLSDKLTEQQHSYHDQIVSALHVHLDAHNCLEVLVVRGKAGQVRAIADELIGVKGVKHGKLVMTTSGADLR